MEQRVPGGSKAENGYERRDMSVRAVGAFLGGLIVAVVVVLLLMGWLFDYFRASEARRGVPPSPVAEARQVPPPPRLQVHPRRDLKALLTEENSVLASYGWVDRKAGIARIPIERAMKLLAERGLPAKSRKAGR